MPWAVKHASAPFPKAVLLRIVTCDGCRGPYVLLRIAMRDGWPGSCGRDVLHCQCLSVRETLQCLGAEGNASVLRLRSIHWFNRVFRTNARSPGELDAPCCATSAGRLGASNAML